MTSLWTSDLHLNENKRDSYRWEFMSWLEKAGLERKVDFIGITGDLTDAKDNHAASLVNRIGDHFAGSRNHWVVDTGNHDYIDPGCPFFRFLDNFENVTWVTEPTVLHLPVADKKVPTLLLPATKEWEVLWPPNLEDYYPYIFMHGTFAGTLSENGFELPGIPVEFFLSEGFGQLYAGDIHTPGKIARRMEYIGAPYRVHFGDTYTPRVVSIGARGTEDLYPPVKSRHVVTIRNADDLAKYTEVREDDQVKLRVQLKRSEFPEWRKLRTLLVSEAEALSWEVCGIELLEFSPVRRRLGEDAQEHHSIRKSPEDHLREYAAAQKYREQVIKFGLELLRCV